MFVSNDSSLNKYYTLVTLNLQLCPFHLKQFLCFQDNQLDETNPFEVTVTTDGVSTSGISGSDSPQIVLEPNTLSWGINECSSSFQSASSCETLESIEHNALNTESPQVIIVPFLADNATDNDISGTVLTNNGLHTPMMKDSSVRIDHSSHCDEINVDTIIEIPFSTSCATDCSTVSQTCFLSDDDSSEFEGFGVESTIGTEYELYKKALSSIEENVLRAENNSSRQSSEPILTECILTERHLTERPQPDRHQPDRHPPERIIKTDSVKRPRQIERKISEPQLSENQNASISQSRIENTEINLPTSKQNSTVNPIPIRERILTTPVENDGAKSNKQDSSSDSSDSDVAVTPGKNFVLLLRKELNFLSN